MKKTLEQFKEELNTKDKEITAIERREGNRVFLRVKCKKCGEEKVKNPQQIKLYGCRKCEGANITSRQRQTLDQIKERLKEKDVEVLELFIKRGKQKKGRTFVKTKCNKHKTITITSSLQIEKKFCCKECADEEREKKNNLNKKENIFANKRPELINFFKNKDDAFNYKFKSHKKTTIICPTCKAEYEKSFENIYSYGVLCEKCRESNSKAEKIMTELLIQCNKNFKREKTFEWSEKYRYDFYLEDEKIIIETHGEQHYKERGTFFKKTLLEQQAVDRKKKELALGNGIKKYIEIDCSSVEKQVVIKKIEKELCFLLDFKTVKWNDIFFKLETKRKETKQTKKEKQDEKDEIIKKLFIGRLTIEEMVEKTKLTKEQIKRILVKLCKKKEINYKPKAIKKKVFRYDLFGNLLGVYCSVRNAAIETNNTEQGVSLCCRNKNKTSKKEIFSFEELTKKQIEERLQND